LLRHFYEFWFVWLSVTLTLATAGCSTTVPEPPPRSVGFVRGADVPLRDQLGPASALIGTLDNGEEVEIISTRPRWSQVRTSAGQTGWMQSRFLADANIPEQFVALAGETAALPSQGTAAIDREANLHLEPHRESETFYQFAEGHQVDVLAHRVAERGAPLDAAPEDGDSDGADSPPPAQIAVRTPEDWLLVRDSEGNTGWMLERLADMNPPFDVGQYREGLRIRAWFVLHREIDDGIERPWYLWATIRRLAGLPYDFDEIRVFVWNPNRDRYETSYRERNLIGFYPIEVSRLDKPGGSMPVFKVHVEDESGKRLEKSYVMEGRLVRRTP
jgi:SH3-like domain-containing protein